MIMADAMLGKADRNPLKGLEWPAVPGHFRQALVPAAGRALLQDPRPISVRRPSSPAANEGADLSIRAFFFTVGMDGSTSSKDTAQCQVGARLST